MLLKVIALRSVITAILIGLTGIPLQSADRLKLVSEKKVHIHTISEIAQPWIGISEDELDIVRLDLHPDGTGFGAYIFVDHAPQVFRIDAWLLKGYSITVQAKLAELEDKADGELKGEVVAFKMDLIMSGRGWHRRLWLRPEHSIESKLDELRKVMATAQPGGQRRRRAF
jgi:hypothetical protein